MIPIVVSTYPENGSQDMELNSPIKVVFAGSIDFTSVTVDHIKLENKNDGRDIPIAFTYDSDTFELEITPEDDLYTNMLLGLTKYELSMSNISSTQGEVMKGLHTMEFFTISDTIEDVIIDPTVVTDAFVVTNYYPKQDSYGVSPNIVKIKCNKDVLDTSVNSDTFIITTDTIEDINDIGFISIDTVTGEYSIVGGTVSFKPYKSYSEILGLGLLLTDGSPRKEFQLTNYPVYQASVSIDGVEVTVDVDYTVDFTTGAVSFIDGFEPAVDTEVTAETQQRIPLSDNKKYTVVLSGIQSLDTETLDATMYSFYSAFSPLYATLADIQTTYFSIAAIIKSANPLDVLQIIKANSEMAKWIAIQNGNELNIDWDTPDKIVIEYVKSKTRYDLVFDSYIQMSNDATQKVLGDLDISYSRNIADLLTLVDKMRLTYEYWESMLKGSTSGKSRAQAFRKGENIDIDPEYKARGLKDWTGTKSW